MTAPLIHMHANTYFVSKACFSYGIFDITEEQEQELKSMHEILLVCKLNLGSIFPRKLLHSRVTSIGVGMMAPRIAIAVLTIKLYMSRQRMESENEKLMQMTENNQIIESRARSIQSKINNKAYLAQKL